MKSVLYLITLLGISAAAPDPWSMADTTCYKDCGRAMREFDKCQDSGHDYHNCVCNANSRFHAYYDKCNACPSYIFKKFSAGFRSAERECGLARV